MTRTAYFQVVTIVLLAPLNPILRAQQADTTAGPTPLTAASPASEAGPTQTPVNVLAPSDGQPSAPEGTMPPLSGAQVLAPTFQETTDNYWLPAMACMDYVTSNPSGLNQHSGVFSQSSCVGNLTLQNVERRSQLNFAATVGGFYYNRPYEVGAKQYGTDGELGAFETVSGDRWKLLLGDQATYLPQGSLGAEGLAGVSGVSGGPPVANAPALNGGFSPDQSIFYGMDRRFSDLVLSEFGYAAGPRTTFTATAMFGTLQFFTPGNIDNRSWSVMGGYNRTLSRRDEVALAFEETRFSFGSSQPEFLNHAVSILYGRKISSKLAVELSVAPSAVVFSSLRTGSTTNFFLGTYDILGYRGPRWDASLLFDRSLTGGSGVLAGAERTVVTGTVGRQLRRRLHGDVNVAYSGNQALAPFLSAVPRPAYNYVQAGINVTHKLGQSVSVYVNYYVQRQTSNVPLCEGITCSTLYFQQAGGVGINWHARPMRID